MATAFGKAHIAIRVNGKLVIEEDKAMNIVSLIEKKKNGQVLKRQELEFLISGFSAGNIPDYQMSAFLMASYFNGFTDDEVIDMTRAMINSGKRLNLRHLGVVDKHSTGGVGDKISLISCPIAASCGVKIGKMSGRGLGFTGGTVDKLESIPNFKVDIPLDEFEKNINKYGISIISQRDDIAKADKMIYALRDVTATVDIKGLVAASIMSKKIATGSSGIVLDIKFGYGALMRSIDEAKELGRIMELVGKAFDIRVKCIFSDMNQPLGREIGNINEIKESIEVLLNRGDELLRDEAVNVAAELIYMAGRSRTLSDGAKMAGDAIVSGKAFEKFKEFVSAQNGDISYIDNPNKFPKCKFSEVIYARDVARDISESENKNKGIFEISGIFADDVGMAAVTAGAGRMKKDESIDYAAGVSLFVRKNDRVGLDAKVAEIYGNDREKVEKGREILSKAFILN